MSDESDEDRGEDTQRDHSTNPLGFNPGDYIDTLISVHGTLDNFQQNVVPSMVRSANTIQTISESLPSKETLVQVAETVRRANEYLEEVRTTVEENIDLDEPWNYNSEQSNVDNEARDIAIRWTVEFLARLNDIDDPYFNTLFERMNIGLMSYMGDDTKYLDEEIEPKKPRPHEAIFIFISSQDSLMHWLCEQDDTVSPIVDDDYETVYKSSDKKDVLSEKYSEYIGIAEGEHFSSNLESFYKHRNFIMHGDPGAHFDMNIATVSLLFFSLTLHTVLEEAEQE